MRTIDIQKEMPCKPNDLHPIPLYMMGTLDSMEREIAAAIVLQYSQKADKWVGINVEDLNQRIVSSREEYKNYEKAKQALFEWNTYNKYMLGLYGFITKKPQDPETIKYDQLGQVFGEFSIPFGFSSLLEDHSIECREGYFFPTSKHILNITSSKEKSA